MSNRYIGTEEICAPSSIGNPEWPKNINEADKCLFKGPFQRVMPETKTYKYSNVTLNSDLIYIHNGELLTGTAAFCHILKTKPFFAKLIFIRRRMSALDIFKRKRKCKNIDKAILITEQWSYEYGHWFCESLPRLFSMHNNLSDIHLLLPIEYKKYNYITYSLSLFDIKVIYFDSSDSFFIEELVIPHYLLLTGDFCKEIICGMSAHIHSHVGNSKNHNEVKRLYISRQHAKRRKVSNEDEVIALVKRYGFEVLATEKIPYDEVLTIYKNVEIFISLHGAGLTNMVFMPPVCKVLELRRQGDFLNNIFYSLAYILGHEYYYQVCKSKYNNPVTWCADLVVDIDKLEENLKLMF